MNNILGLLFMIAVIVAGMFGWWANVYKLTQLDFETPYKAEIVRGIGIPVAPLGALLGYVDIEDGKASK